MDNHSKPLGSGADPRHIPEGNRQSNVERFSGYENTYDQYRPEAPEQVINILTGYLQQKPSLVVDLGCGTGLSSFVWKDEAERIIGIEPNDDMRGKAEEKLQEQDNTEHISFAAGYSNQIGLEASSVDIITCSQSFHWMEPASTLKEAARILRPEGIFAVYDCDWPPSLHWPIEQSYHELIEFSEIIIDRHIEEGRKAHKWNKNEHLKHIRESGLFRFAKEIVFHHMEPCTAERYVGLAISQGGVQTLLRLGIQELNPAIDAFRKQVEEYFQGETREVMFSYRMRLGIK
ncbi:MAG: class I SAM-dependent methyltransferase [Bacillota bacterium]